MSYYRSFLTGMIVAGFAYIAAPVDMSAADNGIIVIARDGSRHEVIFDNLNYIEIGNTAVTVHHSDGDSHTHDYTDVDRILIGAKTSAIDNVTAAGDIAIWPSTVVEAVNVAGAKAGAVITVADTAGRQFTTSADSDGTAIIDVTAMAPGVIIVNVNNHSVKLIKK